MKKQNSNLQVEAIQHGTVLDHIPSGQGIKILRNLQLLDSKTRITVGFNLPSKVTKLKDLIKIERYFGEEGVHKLSIFAPYATINIIENYQVIRKEKMQFPEKVIGLFRCPNSNCITHDEEIASYFKLSREKGEVIFTCFYCEKCFSQNIMTEK